MNVLPQTVIGSPAYRLEVWFTDGLSRTDSQLLRDKITQKLKSVASAREAVPKLQYRAHTLVPPT